MKYKIYILHHFRVTPGQSTDRVVAEHGYYSEDATGFELGRRDHLAKGLRLWRVCAAGQVAGETGRSYYCLDLAGRAILGVMLLELRRAGLHSGWRGRRTWAGALLMLSTTKSIDLLYFKNSNIHKEQKFVHWASFSAFSPNIC